MINHDEKYIFVHVPRTGGFSGYQALGIRRDWTNKFELHIPRRETPETYFSFGIIRNPWERMYSCYCRQRVFEKYQGISFKRWLDIVARDNVGQSAMYFLTGCDYIGRFEDLQASWDEILRRIGRPAFRLPEVNKYMHGDYTKAYDDELIERIGTRHADDVSFGGYRFGESST